VAWLDGDMVAYFGVVVASYRQSIILDGVIAAVLICGVWLVFIRRLDVFEPESLRSLLLVLFAGALCSEAMLPIYDFINITLGFEMGKALLHQLAYCVFSIGLSEEAVKLLPVLLIVWLTKRVNESTDYIIYASISALGFALMENIGYFNRYGLDHIGGRAFTATLFHMALTSLAIYGLVYARYRKKSLWYFAMSFAGACVLHGLYDFLIVGGGFIGEMRIMSLAVLVVTISLYASIFRNALGASEFFEDADRRSHFRSSAFFLACGLSYVVVAQYVILALRFGPDLANRSVGGMLVVSYIMIAIIWGQFVGLRPEHASWLSIFGREPSRLRRPSPEHKE
jgi:protease PrsW